MQTAEILVAIAGSSLHLAERAVDVRNLSGATLQRLIEIARVTSVAGQERIAVTRTDLRTSRNLEVALLVVVLATDGAIEDRRRLNSVHVTMAGSLLLRIDVVPAEGRASHGVIGIRIPVASELPTVIGSRLQAEILLVTTKHARNVCALIDHRHWYLFQDHPAIAVADSRTGGSHMTPLTAPQQETGTYLTRGSLFCGIGHCLPFMVLSGAKVCNNFTIILY